MLLGSLAFSLMGALAHALAASFDWQVIALARCFLALLFASALARAAGVRFVWFRPRTLWLRSLAGSVSLVCTFFALTRLPISDVLTLTNTFPIWVAVLSRPLLKEPLPGGVWLSVLTGVAGVVLIQSPHLAEGNFAALAALGAAFFTALAMIGLHRLQRIDLRAIVVHFSGVSLLCCLAALAVFGHTSDHANAVEPRQALMLLGLGVSATVGQLFLTKAFAAGTPARVSVVGLTQVVFALAFDVLVWGRSLGPTTLLGMALVVAPTAWLMARHPGNGGSGDGSAMTQQAFVE
jgi:drug/metabolite transporter (DMT)-like permease